MLKKHGYGPSCWAGRDVAIANFALNRSIYFCTFALEWIYTLRPHIRVPRPIRHHIITDIQRPKEGGNLNVRLTVCAIVVSENVERHGLRPSDVEDQPEMTSFLGATSFGIGIGTPFPLLNMAAGRVVLRSRPVHSHIVWWKGSSIWLATPKKLKNTAYFNFQRAWERVPQRLGTS